MAPLFKQKDSSSNLKIRRNLSSLHTYDLRSNSIADADSRPTSTSPLRAHTPPFSLVETPPTPDGTPRNINAPSYFALRKRRSATLLSQISTPSDNFSTPPFASPPAGSPKSFGSDSTSAACNISENAYLSPPHQHPDYGSLSFDPRQPSSDNTSTSNKLRRARTMPDMRISDQQTSRRKRRCRHRKLRKLDSLNPEWSLPGCQLAPTAADWLKVLCYGRSGKQLPPITRRWSSVETGSHPITLTSKIQEKTRAPREDIVLAEISSQASAGKIQFEIAQTVRDRLGSRRFSLSRSEAPPSVTLTTATGHQGGAFEAFDTSSSSSQTPQNDASASLTLPSESLYLIMPRDIDFVAKLIEVRPSTSREVVHTTLFEPQLTIHSAQTIQVPKVTSKGLIPMSASAAATKVTNVQVSSARQASRTKSLGALPSTAKLLQTSAEFHPDSSNDISGLLWDANETPSSSNCTNEATAPVLTLPEQRQARKVSRLQASCSTQQRTLFEKWPLFGSNAYTPAIQVSSAEDSTNRLFSSSEGSSSEHFHSSAIMRAKDNRRHAGSGTQSKEQHGRNKEAMVTTDFERVKSSVLPKLSLPPAPTTFEFPKFEEQTTGTLNVTSFPPLVPRKTTNDWRSPLPDINLIEAHRYPQALYNVGLDMNGTPSRIGLEELCPRLTAADLGAASKTANQELMAKAKLSEGKISPAPGISKVSTIDNIHKGERIPSTKWRPPSVCPPPRSGSESEYEDAREEPFRPTTPEERDKRRKSQFRERMDSLNTKAPACSKVNEIGIYGQFTGSQRSFESYECEIEGCRPHVCGDSIEENRNPSIDWIG